MVEANPKPAGQYSKVVGWVERERNPSPAIVSMGFAMTLGENPSAIYTFSSPAKSRGPLFQCTSL